VEEVEDLLLVQTDKVMINGRDKSAIKCRRCICEGKGRTGLEW
jgi:hypothetical protein